MDLSRFLRGLVDKLYTKQFADEFMSLFFRVPSGFREGRIHCRCEQETAELRKKGPIPLQRQHKSALKTNKHLEFI